MPPTAKSRAGCQYRWPADFIAATFPTKAGRIRRDLAAFQPNIIHVASPDPAPQRMVTWARHRQIAVLGSVHTRFDTYPRYYNMAWIEQLVTAIQGLILSPDSTPAP